LIEITFNIIIAIIAGLLVIFVLNQKNNKRKLDTIILIAGATIMLIINKPIIWISIFVLIFVYFFIRKSIKHHN
jgi:hypothetical protein